MDIIAAVKEMFAKINVKDYYPNTKSYDDCIRLARQSNSSIYTSGGWHSGEGYCDDTWTEVLIVESPFGEQCVMSIPVERLNHINYIVKNIGLWYNPEKYTEKYMKPKMDTFLKELAEVKFYGYEFVGDNLKFRSIPKIRIRDMYVVNYME